MQDLALKISEELKTLQPLYIKEVYDFITFLKEKQKKESDTVHLSWFDLSWSLLPDGKLLYSWVLKNLPTKFHRGGYWVFSPL
jgi:hypothetical protein